MFSSSRSAIAAIAEELDATRKAVLAEHADLTLTGLYNLREKVEANLPLDLHEQDQRIRGRVDIIVELHRQLDSAVAAAYGWPATLSDEEVVARLVALNAERAEEERSGKVRWLRPDYQLARAGVSTLTTRPAVGDQLEAALSARPTKPPFPRDAVGQTAAVLEALRSGHILAAPDIARRYSQGMKAAPRIEATLAALARLGHVSVERGGYRLRRVA